MRKLTAGRGKESERKAGDTLACAGGGGLGGSDRRAFRSICDQNVPRCPLDKPGTWLRLLETASLLQNVFLLFPSSDSWARTSSLGSRHPVPLP